MSYFCNFGGLEKPWSIYKNSDKRCSVWKDCLILAPQPFPCHVVHTFYAPKALNVFFSTYVSHSKL